MLLWSLLLRKVILSLVSSLLFVALAVIGHKTAAPSIPSCVFLVTGRAALPHFTLPDLGTSLPLGFSQCERPHRPVPLRWQERGQMKSVCSKSCLNERQREKIIKARARLGEKKRKDFYPPNPASPPLALRKPQKISLRTYE